MSGTPPSLSWVPLFVASANRALDGDIVATTVVPRTDPLQWALVLTHRSFWPKKVQPFARMMLRDWAGVNDAQVLKTAFDWGRFSVLLAIRGLGPEMKINPYEEDSDAARRRARRLDHRPAIRR